MQRGEDPLAVAMREFAEELGSAAAAGPTVRRISARSCSRAGRSSRPSRSPATSIRPRLQSNRFELEWPPKSGRMQSFPEVDRAAVVRARRGAQEDPAGPGAVHRPVARTAPAVTGCATRSRSLTRRRSALAVAPAVRDRPFFDTKSWTYVGPLEAKRGKSFANDRCKVGKTSATRRASLHRPWRPRPAWLSRCCRPSGLGPKPLQSLWQLHR